MTEQPTNQPTLYGQWSLNVDEVKTLADVRQVLASFNLNYFAYAEGVKPPGKPELWTEVVQR
jgi:hypothetical protein